MAKTIVLADDSPTIQKIVELTFSDTEIRVEHESDGAKVVDRVASSRADLLLADVALPGDSGYEICRRVKASARPVPVLLLGGTFEPLDRDRARDCGADGHLIKPFEPSALRARVEDLLSATPRRSAPREPERRRPAAAAPRSDAGGSGAERVEVAAGAADRAAAEPVPAGLVDAVAREVLERLSDRVVREIAREVVPELAARIIRERIRELEQEDPD